MSHSVKVLVAAGRADDMQPREVRVIDLPKGPLGIPRQAIVLLDEARTLRAYRNLCRHLPIPLNSGSRDFLVGEPPEIMCRTHGAMYRLNDGFCTAGPCRGTSLWPLELVEDAGQLYVVDSGA